MVVRWLPEYGSDERINLEDYLEAASTKYSSEHVSVYVLSSGRFAVKILPGHELVALCDNWGDVHSAVLRARKHKHEEAQREKEDLLDILEDADLVRLHQMLVPQCPKSS